MKRSKFINLDRMRKSDHSNQKKLKDFAFKPLVLGIAATIVGCSSSEEVIVVHSVEDCVSRSNLNTSQCEAAYKKAVEEAARTGPKYASQRACESEFGQCQQTNTGSMWMPFMAGFMVSNLIDSYRSSGGYYGSSYYNPVYRYSRPYSRYHDKVMTADGHILGDWGKSSYRADKSVLSQKPKVTKTVSRGGFGSKASAKSSWGGGKSSRGWGG